MDIERMLREELSIVVQQIGKVEKDMAKRKITAGDGKLACTTSNGVPQYFIDGEYVSKKDLSRVKSIAQFEYEMMLMRVLNERRCELDKLLFHYEDDSIEKVYGKMCKGRKNVVTPLIEDRAEFIKAWENVEYPPSNRWEDVKTEIYTHKNERVRSKVEKIIADELTNYGIPYRYEFPYVLTLGKKRIEFRPDFTTLNCRTRKEFVIEHLGMMDKVGYYNSSLSKIDAFERNGYVVGVDLIILHETYDEPISIPVLRRYIEEYLL